MSQRRHTPEQVIRKLAEGHKLLAGGMDVEEVCRQFGIAESTWARWLAQYGGMKADDATSRTSTDLQLIVTRRRTTPP